MSEIAINKISRPLVGTSATSASKLVYMSLNMTYMYMFKRYLHDILSGHILLHY